MPAAPDTAPLVALLEAAGYPRADAALLQRAERGPIAITLLMPAPSVGSDGREAARAGLDAAGIEGLR